MNFMKITILIRKIIIISFSLLLNSCEEEHREESSDQIENSEIQPIEVKTMVLSFKPFKQVILSNGKISVHSQSKLNFLRNGIIESISVKNGNTIRGGQIIASLINNEEKLALKQSMIQLAEAKVEINDLLISQGGIKDDSLSVKKDVWSYIKIKSGYERALLFNQKANNDLYNTYLKAPYDGEIANLTSKSYSEKSSGEPFCTILSKKNVWVEFLILETELSMIENGQTAYVYPVAYPQKNYKAKIVEINPVVSEEGLVKVKAELLKRDSYILEGMNVKVKVEKDLKNKLVVPKEAIVERSGRKVIFVYEKKKNKVGFAKWSYVTNSHENELYTIISSGLKPGQEIIIDGNINLGHDAIVIKH